MKVAVLKETRAGERRVALVPQGVKALLKAGLEVTIQTGAGLASSVSDTEYREAGATIAASAPEALRDAGMVLAVHAPPPADVAAMSEGTILVSFLSPLTNPDLVRALAASKITGIAMEMIPRITRAQSMDALSSQATVAGYKAVLIAADHLPKFLPMFTTAAGTIRPAKALILGAGGARHCQIRQWHSEDGDKHGKNGDGQTPARGHPASVNSSSSSQITPIIGNKIPNQTAHPRAQAGHDLNSNQL